jgi:sugar phosphate isomerase/epimerase
MRLSVTTDMFNYSYKPRLMEKLNLFKRYGFDYIHWCDNWNDDVLYSEDDMRLYAKAIEDADLECLDVHGTATRKYSIDSKNSDNHAGYVKLLENRVRFCHMVGGDAVVVHPPKYYRPNLEKRVNTSKKSLETVKDLCIDIGVTLAIENCHRGDHNILGDYFHLYEPEFIGWCYDSGHANLHRNLEHLKKHGNRLKVTHLHDNKGLLDDHQYPGWGTIDWKDVSQWLKGLDYSKPWNLEVTHVPVLSKGTMEEFLEKTVESAGLL